MNQEIICPCGKKLNLQIITPTSELHKPLTNNTKIEGFCKNCKRTVVISFKSIAENRWNMNFNFKDY